MRDDYSRMDKRELQLAAHAYRIATEDEIQRIHRARLDMLGEPPGNRHERRRAKAKMRKRGKVT